MPSLWEIHNTHLDAEVVDTEKYVNEQKKRWEKYRCTILTNGWTRPTILSIINIMVYCGRATAFLKSIDASKHTKTKDYIYDILKEVVKDIGKHNVVQLVKDNRPNYKEAGKKLMRHYNLY